MDQPQKQWLFNFGPIARTVAGDKPIEKNNVFNLSSLALHVMLDALMAATSRDEFVAWLWHDLFKPTFYWTHGSGNFKWNHVPGLPPFAEAEHTFATNTGIHTGPIRTHHRIPKHLRATFEIKPGEHKFRFTEADIIEDQFDQVGLGREAHYVQLAFITEPAVSSALVRAVIADSFIEAVTKSVAKALKTTLVSKQPQFSRVRFVFQTQRGLRFPAEPTESEIWSQVGQQYDVQVKDDEFIMRHVTPVNSNDSFDTEFIVDLTGEPLTPEQMIANTFGLSELLTVYQDNQTILMAIPQPAIYPLDITSLKSETLALTKTKLELLDVLTLDEQVDLLKIAFDSQVEVRLVPPVGNSSKRSIDLVIGYTTQRLCEIAKTGRHCRVCGSAFESNLLSKNKWPGHDFTDTEYLGSGKEVCPLCRIYTINSHKSRTPDEKQRGITGDRKALRGSFALIVPSSHFNVKDDDCHLVDKPPLDVGGRFDLAQTLLHRVTVTQQEFVLFNQMSRRIIADLWRKIEPTAALPLPYLGGILLTQREAKQVRKVLPVIRELLAPVTLLAYPFEIKVTPGVEIALDVVLTDFKQHHTKHTYLKSRANVFPIHPDSRLFILADSKLQIELNRDWFDAYDRLAAFTAGMSSDQRKEWLRRVTGGSDIMTAYFESTQTNLLSKRGSAPTAEQTAFSFTGSFWTKQFGDDPNQAWIKYAQLSTEIRSILDRYPMLPQLFSAMTERKGIEDDNRDTTDASEETNGSSAGRGTGRRRQSSAAKRSKLRRQASS